MDYQITDIKFRPFTGENNPSMVGYVSCVFNGLFLNNIIVKFIESGKVILTYPRYARGTNDREHFYFNPVLKATRDALDKAILEHIRGNSGTGAVEH